MIRLDATTRKLQAVLAGAVTASQLPVTVCYSDKTTTAYTGGTTVINTNSATAVDICAAPAASTVRDVDTIVVQNADTAAATLTVRYNDNGTLYTLFKATLAVGDQLTYVHGQGWRMLDSAGNAKSLPSGISVASGKTLQINNSLIFAGTDGTTMTFPSTSATLARTDAANVFTGVQTMTSPAITTPAFTGAFSGTYSLEGTPTINVAAAVGGTWTAAATWTLPAFTLGGAVTGNGQNVSGLGTLGCGAITSSVSNGAVLTASSGGNNFLYQTLQNTGGQFYFGLNNSTGTGLLAGAGNNATVLLNTSNTPMVLGVNSAENVRLTNGATYAEGLSTNSLSVSGSASTVTSVNSTNATGGYETWKTSDVANGYRGDARVMGYGSPAANSHAIRAVGDLYLSGGDQVTNYARMTSGGMVLTGTLSVTGLLTVGGSTPASASASGTTGTITWDASYIYVCTATNTWTRVAIATW